MKRNPRSIPADVQLYRLRDALEMCERRLRKCWEQMDMKNPLKKGYSRRTISGNIRREVRRGYPVKRAAAMSYRSAKQSWKRRRKGERLPAYLSRNPMKMRQHGSNQSSVTLDDGTTVYFSYETPVAAFIPGRGFVSTEKMWSRTTNRHVGNFYRESGAKTRSKAPQEFFDTLIGTTGMKRNPRRKRRRNPVRRDAAARSIRTTRPHPTRFVARRSGLTPRTAQAARMGANPRKRRKRRTRSGLPIRVQIKRGRTWQTTAWYKDTPAQISNAKKDAGRYARFYKTRARVVRA